MEQERKYPTCNSSPIASNGNVYLSDNEGKTFVVKAGSEFKLLETNSLEERISASPAITGKSLIYRTDSHLYCVGETGKNPKTTANREQSSQDSRSDN